MDRLIERCAGIDVHQQTMVATVRVPAASGERAVITQTFGTMTADLLVLREWRQAHAVTHVAMESTGVYWRPLYYLLEDGCTVLLINMQHLSHVPGRKSDVRRQRMVGAAPRMWPPARQPGAAGRHSRSARRDSLPQAANRRSRAGSESAPPRVAGCRPQADDGDDRRARRVRPRHGRSAVARHDGSDGARRLGPRTTPPQTARLAAGAARPVSTAARVSGHTDSRED
jgi:transposase